MKNEDFPILYDSDEMVVIHKPADIPMCPSGESKRSDTTQSEPVTADGAEPSPPTFSTVEDWALHHLQSSGTYDEENARLQALGLRKRQVKIVHRLDYATSGVLALAFTKDMAARLAHCFEMRTTQKYYLAIAKGHLDVATFDAPSTVPGVTVVSAAEVRAALPELSKSNTQVTTYREICNDTVKDTAAAPDDEDVFASVSADAKLLRIERSIGYDPRDPEHFRMTSIHPADSESAQIIVPDAREALTYVHVLQHGHLDQGKLASSSAEAEETTSPSADSDGGASSCALPQSPTPVSLLLLMPKTGRRHQLRVHTEVIGHPIVGDVLYCCQPTSESASSTVREVERRWPRMYLHAWRLCLPVSVRAPTSEKERVTLKKKRRRETLGIEGVAATPDVWSQFIAANPFPALSSASSA